MRLLQLCAASLLALPLAAHAFPITYTETATASGSLGGQTFSNALVTFTGTGDTTNVVNYSGPDDFYNRVPITLTVTGVGTTTLNSVNIFYADVSGNIGVADPSAGYFVLGILGGPSYNLQTLLSPVSGSAQLGGTGTANGSLSLTSASNITFQATPAAATPEPSSLALLGTGMLGLVGAARRRFA